MSRADRPGTIAVGGPTATGKTVLAVELAVRTGAELVNADSRQVVRRLVAGTARPSDEELRGVRCHLLDLCEPGDPFTVADWLAHARACLGDLSRRGVPAVVVGGTGQYLRALRQGWEPGAPPDPATRAALTSETATPDGLDRLVAELRERDEEGAATVDLANPRRVIRALELVRATGLPLAQARRSSPGHSLELVVLDAGPEVHDAALAARLDAMFAGGAILAEARAELERGVARKHLRRAGIGYGEAIDVLDGRLDEAAARASVAQRTRRYVKAQRTWFRHEPAALRVTRGATTTTAELAGTVLAALATPGGSPR